MSFEDIQSPLPQRQTIEPVSNETVQPIIAEEHEETVINPTPIIDKPRKKINLKIITVAVGILFFFLIIVLFLRNKGQVQLKKTTTLNYWGLWEDASVMQTIIDDFEAKNPTIKINYKKNQITDYRTRLKSKLDKLVDEETPDIYRIHVRWLPTFISNLALVPTETTTKLELDKDYYEVFKRDLKVNGSYRAIPLMYDGLSLFYNKTLIDQAGVKIPETWAELQSAAEKITQREDGLIRVAGAALGRSDNVDHWSDIVGLMLQQSGDSDENLKTVLTYYTFFNNKYGVWDESLPPSTEYFASGRLGFYFGPSWRIFDIEKINSNLDYGVVTVPQLSSASETSGMTNVHWASYWIEGVNNKSTKQKEIWKFLEFLASKEGAEKLYTAGTQIRTFGQIPARKSLQSQMLSNVKIKPFVVAADNAWGWYLASNTFDNGINDEMITYFADAINGMVKQKKSAEEVLVPLQSGINQLKQKYGIK